MPEQDFVTVSDLVVRFPVKVKGKPSLIQPVAKVSFSIAKGEVLALVGESGSGKTTIGRALVRTLEPTSGQIIVGGKDVTHIRGSRLKSYRLVTQMIFQDPFASLNPVKTVERHLAFPVGNTSKLRGGALTNEIDDLLTLVGLTPAPLVRRKYPHELSGGQRQRLSIARALALNPKLMIADEPISMLDVSIRAGILKLMKKLRDDMGLSYLYITHDLASARYFGDRIMVLYGGIVMEVAKSPVLVGNPVHPYTRLLLAATPGRDHAGALPETSNEPPDLALGRRGCPFATRCPLVTDICRTAEPDLREIEPQHFVACHVATS